MEYAEERPPLLSLPGMGARLATYYRKRSPADGNAASLKSGGGFLGQIVPLEPAEPTPFLGQVPEGQSVTSLETSLYRAPAFRHKVPTTDFVLIRSNHGKLSLRKATGLHLVGQEVGCFLLSISQTYNTEWLHFEMERSRKCIGSSPSRVPLNGRQSTARLCRTAVCGSKVCPLEDATRPIFLVRKMDLKNREKLEARDL